MPRMRRGRLSSRWASSARPSASASRIRDEEISRPSSSIGSTTSKSISASAHHLCRIRTSPRSWPKASWGPPPGRRQTAGRSPGQRTGAGRQIEQPSPGPEHGHLGGSGLASRAFLIGPDQGQQRLAAGGRPDAGFFNVTARAGTPAASACARKRPIKRWCPRCTPSKFPTVTSGPGPARECPRRSRS